MNEPASKKEDPRLEEIVDMLTRLASGDLGARLSTSDAEDQLEVIINGLNMVAEELAASIGEERKAKEMLELRVEERTAELQTKVTTIEAQSRTILELSTPVLQVWDGILVLPLIGDVDTKRANQVAESVLEAIGRTQARFIILDITGVPVIDTAVADHLLKTIKAARLLGAEVIVTGVSSYNARTIVRLGVDLKETVTRGTLQSGLKSAMQIAGQEPQPGTAPVPFKTSERSE